ncbi:MAG: DNA primase [bacterium]|nr:DNA primase [bacterium]
MDQIEEVRSKIDLVKLASEYFTLTKSGRNFKALCPFHGEKTPSLMISPERQIWKCFGCGKGGSAYNLLMEMEGMEFGEALRALAKRAGVTLLSYKPSSQESEKDHYFEINHLTSEFFHYLLVSHLMGKKALEYLLGRGISKESIRLFKLGYAPSLNNGLQKFLIGKRGYKAEDLFKMGLVTRTGNDFRDFFRDRIIFPLRDHRGNNCGFAGRVIGAWREENARATGPKYINTSETEIYHKSDLLYGLETTRGVIKNDNQAVVVEGELDLISSYQAGVENVVAIKGSALTESQCRLLKRFCENVVLAFDVDKAGDQASRRGIKIAEDLGLAVKIAQVPEGKDPDELARKSPDLWQKCIKEAIAVYDFFILSAFGRYNGQEAEGKKKIGQEVLPLLIQISDEIMKNHYVRILASKLGVDENSILKQMAKLEGGGGTDSQGASPNQSLVKARAQILQEYLLALVFQSGQGKILLEPALRKMVIYSPYQKILGALAEYLKEKEGEFDSQEFAAILPPELLEIYNHFYLVDFAFDPKDSEQFRKEKEKVLLGLEEIEVRQKMKETGSRMAVLEKEGKEEEMEEVKKTFLLLSRKLKKVS